MEKVVVVQGESEIFKVLQTLEWVPVQQSELPKLASEINFRRAGNKTGIRFRDDTLEWLGYDKPSFYEDGYEMLSYEEFMSDFSLEGFPVPLKEVLDDV